MRRIGSLFFLAITVVVGPELQAAVIPGHYIVQLSTEPVAAHLARQGKRAALRSADAYAHRAIVRAEQADVRRRLPAETTVLASVDTVANALLVTGGDPAILAALPGVRRVLPVREMHLLLDRAVAVDKVVDAWNQVGADNAGAGVKIGIIDTGIDSSNAAFQDASLTVPATFPRVNNDSDSAYTTNKIIVARSYVGLLARRDPDLSARDRVGHGTALAMVSAGARITGPLATIAGVAPKAYLGSYKVFGTPGYNDSSSDSAILKAIDDAVSDGMDVINISLGDALAPRLADDPEVDAIEQATAAGVIVVVAAGNSGPDPNTMSSPATAPSAIAVGASRNGRTFAASVAATGLNPMVAVPGNGPSPSAPVSAPLADVAAIDGNGRACSALPSGSLTGKIALILRGSCTFESKLNTAQQAGAKGAVVFAAADSPDAISMAVGAATLPAEMIANSDGVSLQQAAAQGPITATLTFTLSSIDIDARRLASFSGAGPGVEASIKPDMVAVGAEIYVATQKFDPNGDMYDPSGFILVDGTSFSTPMVAGAAALLKSAHPGLTVDQYRSLLINNAAPINNSGGTAAAAVQQEGAGALDAGAALRGTVATYPTALNFGNGGGGASNQTLTVTNVGSSPDVFTVAVSPNNGDAAPAASAGTVTLAPGGSATITLAWDTTGFPAGGHDGMVHITSAATGADTHVPYWYGATSGTPVRVTVLDSITSARRNSLQQDAILFRITDAAGLPVLATPPQVTVTTGSGLVQTILNHDSDVPGVFGVDVRLGVGTNTFHIQAGNAAADVTITGQ